MKKRVNVVVAIALAPPVMSAYVMAALGIIDSGPPTFVRLLLLFSLIAVTAVTAFGLLRLGGGWPK